MYPIPKHARPHPSHDFQICISTAYPQIQGSPSPSPHRRDHSNPSKRRSGFAHHTSGLEATEQLDTINLKLIILLRKILAVISKTRRIPQQHPTIPPFRMSDPTAMMLQQLRVLPRAGIVLDHESP